MLIAGALLGLLLGLAAGGHLGNLGLVRLRWIALLFAAVILRYTTEAALGANLTIADVLRFPLFTLSYGMLLVGLWVNRGQPGMSLAFVGVLGNAAAIVANRGFMPVWEPSLLAAGFTRADVTSGFHVILDQPLNASFLLSAGPLGDIIPIPFPPIQNVASIGDLFLASGLAFFLFATVLREPQELDEEEAEHVRARLEELAADAHFRDTVAVSAAARGFHGDTSLAPGLSEASALDRPRMLGASATGMAAPSGSPLPLAADAGGAAAFDPAAGAVPVPGELELPGGELLRRARRHPYVRLALNGSFSALWTGQLISLFGDRIHQIALAFLVAGLTGSPAAVGFVFVAATLPNLLFGPIAGTFVDRWDHKEVLIVSDLLRAATILLVPIAAMTNVLLVYPLVFIVTTISIFFRPARVAILPRIVKDDELLTANSALWVGETMADVIGYPLAGLFVAFLGPALPLAFWFDAATYVASAVLVSAIVVPSLARKPRDDDAPETGFFDEMREGWRFLRRDTPLLANTLQASVAQFTIGILIALTPFYAKDVITGSGFDPEAIYAFLETGIGVGNLVGGFLLGLVGARFARGRTIIAGYTLWGAAMAGLALTGNLGVALGLMFGSGIGNMIAVIPSQTMFQERTPSELMGRVVGFRFALVFGAMTIAMGAGGMLGEAFGIPIVIGVFGLLTMVAGLAGLLVPAVRDA